MQTINNLGSIEFFIKHETIRNLVLAIPPWLFNSLFIITVTVLTFTIIKLTRGTK